jgi:hypothetical protein
MGLRPQVSKLSAKVMDVFSSTVTRLALPTASGLKSKATHDVKFRQRICFSVAGSERVTSRKPPSLQSFSRPASSKRSHRMLSWGRFNESSSSSVTIYKQNIVEEN